MSAKSETTHSSASRVRRRRTLNKWLLGISAILLFVIAPIAYFWYYHQTRQLASSLLTRSEQLLKEKKPREAAEYLQRYLQINPKDSGTRIRFAQVYDESASTFNAKKHTIELYNDALRYGENERDDKLHASFKEKEPTLRQRLGELLLEADRFADVETQACKLIEIGSKHQAEGNRLIGKGSKNQAEGNRLIELGSQYQSQGIRLLALTILNKSLRGTLSKQDISRANDELVKSDILAKDAEFTKATIVKDNEKPLSLSGIITKALELNPGDLQLSIGLASMYRDDSSWLSEEEKALKKEERNQRADHCMEEMVSVHPTDPASLLIRYRYKKHYGLPNASEDLVAILKVAPENLVAQAFVAQVKQEAAQEVFSKGGKAEDAIKLLRAAISDYHKILEKSPKEEPFWNLAEIHRQLGELSEAQKSCAQGLEQNPDSIRLNLLLAQILLDQDLTKEAARFDGLQGKEGPLDHADRLIGQLDVEARQESYQAKRQYVAASQAYAKLLRARWYSQQAKLENVDVKKVKLQGDAKSLLAQVLRGDKSDVALQACLLLSEMHFLAEQTAEAVNTLLTFEPENRRWQELEVLPDERLKSSRLLQALALRYEALLLPVDADRALAELLRREPLAADAYLLQAKLAARRGNAEKAQTLLREGIEKVASKDKPQLQRALIQCYLAENQEADAARQLDDLLQSVTSKAETSADAETADLVLAFAERALSANAAEALQHWEDALHKLEESEGPRQHFLKGMKSQREGKLEEAVDAYKNAIRTGYRKLFVYEQLIAVLTQLRRDAEAESYLTELKGQLSGSFYLSSFEISHTTKRGQWQQAIEAARRSAQAQPANPAAALRLSRLLEIDNQIDAASEVLQTALRFNPKDPDVHYQLLTFYKRNGKTDLAKEHLDNISKASEIPAPNLNRLLAQGYELIQDEAKAQQFWKTVANQAKDTAEEQTAVAVQLATRDPAAAEKALRRALQLNKDYQPARLILAELLANQHGEERWNEALELANDKLADPQQERQRQILLAQIYALRGGKQNLKQAREIMEKLVTDQKLPQTKEILLLASINELEGNIEEAKARLQKLAETSANPTVDQLAPYVEILLRTDLPQDKEQREKQMGEIQRWLNKFQTLAPDSPQAIAFTARWMKTCGRAQQEIEQLIEEWIKKQRPSLPKNQQAEIAFFELVGNLYMSLEIYPAAERWFREATERAPDRYPLLAQVLARQGKYEEALQLCQNATQKGASPVPIYTAASLFTEGHPTAKDFTLAKDMLGKAAKTYQNDPDVLNALAAVAVVQPHMEEAEVLYRRVLELRPQDVVVMNNLATVLLEQPGKLSEASELIEKAISFAGPQAGLLDVKGTIMLADNKPELALPILEEAAAAVQTDPRYAFHLAVAYLRTEQFEKADTAFKRAKKLGLDKQILTPGDNKLLTELEKVTEKNATPK